MNYKDPSALSPADIAAIDQGVATTEEIIDELSGVLLEHRRESGHECQVKVCVPGVFVEMLLQMPDDVKVGVLHLSLLRIAMYREREEETR